MLKSLKKWMVLLLAVLMVFCSACSCTVEKTQEPDAAAGSVESVQEKDLSTAPDTYEFGELLQITVDQVAEINNCAVEDLNITYDEKGNITFIGNRFSTEKILKEEDAIEMMTALKDLASIDVDLSYYGVSESRVTGYKYYSFYQTEEVEPNPGVRMLIDTNTGCIKLITDKDGNTVGISSCVGDKEVEQSYPENLWVTKEEALEYVRKQCAEGEYIAEDLTTTSYLADEGVTIRHGILSKQLPCWNIVTNYPLLPGWNGTLYCVSMIGDSVTYTDGTQGKEPYIAQFVPILSPDEEGMQSGYDVYTSLAFFSNMEDAGEYTFHIKEKDWVTDAVEGYEFQESDITVPLMYDTANGVYVLGDYNSKTLVSDYHSYYVQSSAVPNWLISETPEDLNSWRWRRPKVNQPDGTEAELFLNMSYALSSYATLLNVHKNYKEHLGVDSYDGIGIPKLLALYETNDSSYYPDSMDGFVNNATNFGVYCDWAMMATSPVASYCADEVVLGHEYAHGIDRSNSALKMGNMTGSVEEGFADVIGISLYNASHGENKTAVPLLDRTSKMRDIADPNAYCQPKYVESEYFLPEMDLSDSTAKSTGDNGGVHINNSITTNIAYSMTNNNPELGDAALSWSDVLKLFYEASFCRTTDYDYDELGAYLRFAAAAIGLEPEKQETVAKTVKDHGFSKNRDDLNALLEKEGVPEIRITVNFDDESAGKAFAVYDLDHDSPWAIIGKDPVTIRRSPEHQTGTVGFLYSPYQGTEDKTVEIWVPIPDGAVFEGGVEINVKTVRIQPGDTCNFGESVVFLTKDHVQANDDYTSAYFPHACEICATGYMKDNCLTVYHIICGTSDEILEASVEPVTFEKAAQDGETHKVSMVISNGLPEDILEFYLAPSYEDNWGNEVLQGHTVLSGGNLEDGTFAFNSDSLEWDIKIATSDGRVTEFSKLNFASCKLDDGLHLNFYPDEEGNRCINY